MIIVREIMKAKPGQAGKLAKLMKKAFGTDSNMTIMTDLVGDYNTVVAEMKVESLAQFEKEMEEYRSGKAEQKLDPEVAEEMKNYTQMYLTGRREIYQIVE